MAKPKVVLFLPKARKHTFHGTPPIALLKLASMLDPKKFDVKIITAKPDVDYEAEVVENSKDALCVCLSVLTGNDITNAIETIKKIKAVSNAPIIWGGWHASIFPHQTLESRWVDIIIRGQGERTFQELVARLSKKQGLKGLQGCSFKEKGGKIIHNEDRAFEDINNFSPINYDFVNLEDYICTFEGVPSLVSFTSQGCPFSCKFCAEPVVYKRRWSSLTNERVLDEWELFAKKYKVKYVGITDDNFFVDEKKAADFCRKLIKKNLGLQWKACGRARQMLAFKDSTWKLIEKAGCNVIEIGDESGIQSTLDAINKQQTVEEMVEFVKKCQKHKIKVMHNFIYGLPLPQFKGLQKKEINKLIFKEWLAMFDIMDKYYSKEKNYFE